MYIGNDIYYPGWSGYINLVNFNMGKGVFRPGKDFTDDKDIFNWSAGLDLYVKNTNEWPVEKPPVVP